MGVVLACATCGIQPRENARFCDGCGSAITPSPRVAEYKQVTVLFADVVHSMDIAAAVGAERLREIMAGLLDRATTVVGRYGGTVDKFTGDGIMALFGAPMALEDHAVRACRAALEIHSAISDLADEVSRLDGVQLQLRIGLNSGQVIAGEIGSGGAGYTAIGDQVGMAQRMESVAPPGGVMLSAATARLVEGAAALGEPEMVRIKGANEPVTAYRLLGIGDRHRATERAESSLVGRRWEMSAMEGLLDRALGGHGAVVEVVGEPGRTPYTRMLKAAGRQRNLDARAQEIQTALRTEQLAAPAAVTAAFAATTRATVGIIAELNRQITDLEAELATHFETHPDADIYRSLPGLGVILGARVLGEFGDDPNRYTTAKCRKNYAGTSPLTVASGRKRAVLARHVRNRRLYDAVDQWAFCALNSSPGARLFYDARRTAGDLHHQALRALGNRLVGILHGCLRHHTHYDEHKAWAHRQTNPDSKAA